MVSNKESFKIKTDSIEHFELKTTHQNANTMIFLNSNHLPLVNWELT
jgi:hypothetical protein